MPYYRSDDELHEDLIPAVIWEQYGFKTSDSELERMDNPMDFAILPLVDGEKLIKVLICLAYRIPQLDDADLFSAAISMNASFDEIVFLAAISNRTGLLGIIASVSPSTKLYLHTLSSAAAKLGHTDIIDYLLLRTPTDYKPELFSVVFKSAVNKNQLAVLNWLTEKAPSSQIRDMIKANSCAVFHKAINKKQNDLVSYFLLHPDVFTEVEHLSDKKIKSAIISFIREILANWKYACNMLKNKDPRILFDLESPELCQLGFYFMRHLIRDNDPQHHDDIYFLSTIPGIATLIPEAVTPKQPNELMRLALCTGNHKATEILSRFSVVWQQAKNNNFYIAEALGNINLRELSNDQQRCLARTFARYKPQMNALGTEEILNNLRDRLRERYQKYPATIVYNDKILNLPCEWDKFQEIPMSSAEREQALKAYYRHKDHTALRWLSCPNHWIDPDATFSKTVRWGHQQFARFEECNELIALCWLAVSDINEPPTDDHTLEGRIDHFIDELALNGRAHNWDRLREVVLPDGKKILEAYDDGEADNPNCLSGIPISLVQSVIGHSLMNVTIIQTKSLLSSIFPFFMDRSHNPPSVPWGSSAPGCSHSH